MFCAVEITENENGILALIQSLFNRQPPQMKQVNIKSAAPFFYLKISKKQCGENFDKLAEILGRYSKYIIPCGDTEIIDNCYVKKYQPSVFPSIMLINSAEKLLQKKDYNKSSYSIGIVDRKGSFATYIDRFIQLASVVTVFSDNQFVYNQTAEQIFDDYGASLIVRSADSIDFNCDFTIYAENDGFIIDKRNENYIKITGNSFFVDSEIKKLIPEKSDSLLFCSAFYELCGVKKLKSMKYNSFYEQELPQKPSNLLTIF